LGGITRRLDGEHDLDDRRLLADMTVCSTQISSLAACQRVCAYRC
jgi:hypothetical protein